MDDVKIPGCLHEGSIPTGLHQLDSTEVETDKISSNVLESIDELNVAVKVEKKRKKKHKKHPMISNSSTNINIFPHEGDKDQNFDINQADEPKSNFETGAFSQFDSNKFETDETTSTISGIIDKVPDLKNKAFESHDISMRTSAQQFETKKVETDEKENNASENFNREMHCGKITDESEELLLPTCPGQLDLDEGSVDEKGSISIDLVDKPSNEIVTEQYEKEKKRKKKRKKNSVNGQPHTNTDNTEPPLDSPSIETAGEKMDVFDGPIVEKSLIHDCPEDFSSTKVGTEKNDTIASEIKRDSKEWEISNESKNNSTLTCLEQLNFTKVEPSEETIVAYENNEESSGEKITLESKNIQRQTCPEQFNLTKYETDGNEIGALESNEEESSEERITSKLKEIEMPICPEQSNLDKI